MGIFSRKKKPTPEQYEEYVGSLVVLFRTFEATTPEDFDNKTPQALKVLQMDRVATQQAAHYKEQFGEEQEKLATKEATRRMKIK